MKMSDAIIRTLAIALLLSTGAAPMECQDFKLFKCTNTIECKWVKKTNSKKAFCRKAFCRNKKKNRCRRIPWCEFTGSNCKRKAATSEPPTETASSVPTVTKSLSPTETASSIPTVTKSSSPTVTAMPSSVRGGGWVRVRHVPAGNNWHPATDNLAGTDVYGNESDDASAWSVNFEAAVPNYDQFLFSSGDNRKWLIVTKKELVGSGFHNNDRQVLKSSVSSTPYKAWWYFRSYAAEDPWVSLYDHPQSGGWNMLYGENNHDGNKHHIQNGGNDVYIRAAASP
jgi:hypothetical protein